jgi:hypothetical protein
MAKTTRTIAKTTMTMAPMKTTRTMAKTTRTMAPMKAMKAMAPMKAMKAMAKTTRTMAPMKAIWHTMKAMKAMKAMKSQVLERSKTWDLMYPGKVHPRALWQLVSLKFDFKTMAPMKAMKAMKTMKAIVDVNKLGWVTETWRRIAK